MSRRRFVAVPGSNQNPDIAMKLTSKQAAAVKARVNIDPIEEAHPAAAPLRKAFGDHTFYVVSDGLFVLEPVNDPGEKAGEPARFVLVAAWTDEDKGALKPVEPQRTNTVVDLADGGGEASAVNGEDKAN
jgi:hypothetical protein